MSNIIIPPSPVAQFTAKNSRTKIEDLTVYIQPVQSGSGEPSPTNVRPITGWDEITVFHSGKDTSNPIEYAVEFTSQTGTVFSGTLNVSTGTLVVDSRIFNLGELAWIYNAANNVFYSQLDTSVFSSIKNAGSICSCYKQADTFNQFKAGNNMIYIIFWISRGINVKDSRFTNKDDLKAALNGQQYLAKLVNPITYQLTPTEINSIFVGLNNVWADAGEVGLEYSEELKQKIKLNNVDMTDYFTPRGMKVSYVKVKGDNGGTYLSGDREDDVLAWKAVVKLACMPINDQQQSEVLQKVMSDDPTLYYFDPLANDYRTIHYMASVEETVHKGEGGTGIEFWTGLTITAEEK